LQIFTVKNADRFAESERDRELHELSFPAEGEGEEEKVGRFR
jgi:hypothetical protein